MALGSPQWMYKSGGAYEIDQSLRFNDDDESRLVRTPTSNGNRRTFTLSVWVKRGNHTLGTDQEQDIIGAFYASNASRYSYIAFDHNDRIIIFGGEYSTSPTVQSFYRRTQAKYRDSSAWYHIVWRHDSTDGTATNRDRLYVNGVLQDWDTSLGTDLVCGQNEDSFFNYTTSPMTIGEYASTNATSTMEFDGYMAEMHWIDGTSVATTSFGETGDYGEWKPVEYSGSYGTNGFYLNFAGGGVMSATGGTITTDGDYKVHSFTANGTFTPTITGVTQSDVEYLVIAGGGGGGGSRAGGGGAGGYKTGFLGVTTGTGYSITVGAGGSGGASSGAVGSDGANSVLSTITSTGGGGGGGAASTTGADGGSGGGGATSSSGGAASPSGQGNAGGSATHNSVNWGTGGGGGAGAVGVNGSVSAAGAGGDGLASSITGSSVTRAGGGGGGGQALTVGAGGSGGGGAGAYPTGVAGTANTGSGGGGGYNDGAAGAGGAGGSGIVIIRYKWR